MWSGGTVDAGRGCLALCGRQDWEDVGTVWQRVILILWVLPLPLLKSILESMKYVSVYLLQSDQRSQGAGLPEKGKESGFVQPDRYLLSL